MIVSDNHRYHSIKTTVVLLILLVILLAFGAGFVLWTLTDGSIIWYRIMGSLVMVASGFVAIAALAGIVALTGVCYNRSIPHWFLTLSHKSFFILYPLLLGVGKLCGKDKNEIRRSYAHLNNQILIRKSHKYLPEEMLIITPHCLQMAQCTIKITNDISLCQGCERCSITGLRLIKEQYGIDTVVVTGGTLARMRINEKNPRMIIAIACERDLISGLMDMNRFPVYAIINDRPEGPCYNTAVDLCHVENVVIKFVRGD